MDRFVSHTPASLTNSSHALKVACSASTAASTRPSPTALLEQAMNELNFSARAHDRILKVARTLADLDGEPDLKQQHLLEAIQYRTLDRNLWV